MTNTSRFRRLGAFVLLLAWAPVATANAVTCAVWCEMNGGLGGHHAASIHDSHDHGTAGLANPGNTVAGTNCTSPDLLVVSAVAPEGISVPAVASEAAAVSVPVLHSFVSSAPDRDTPPPRV